MSRFNNLAHGKSFNQGCYFTSYGPWTPNLCEDFLYNSLLTKSAASIDQFSGTSFLPI